MTEFQSINSLIKISYTFLLLTPEYLRFRLIAIIRNDMVYVSQYKPLREFLHCFMSPLSVNNDNSFSQLDEIFGAKLWPPTSILHDPLEDWFSSFFFSSSFFSPFSFIYPPRLLLNLWWKMCAIFSPSLGVNSRVGRQYQFTLV